MKVPSDLCSGSCNGDKANCPYPFVCGIANVKFENKMLHHFIGVLVCIGLIVFCVGVLAWL